MLCTVSALQCPWTSKQIGYKTKFSLYKTLVLSILVYCCEAWMNTEKMETNPNLENKAHIQLLSVNYREHNEYLH